MPLLTIMNLFGRSPFAPLQSHMEKVATCVHKVLELFYALEKGDQETLERLARQISELEHQANVAKNDIRNHLPKSLFLPVDRAQLLEILALQDRIADAAEDIAVLVLLKTLELPPAIQTDFKAFLDKNIECFEEVRKIIHEFNDLIESSFGGNEAQKVRDMVEKVSFKEHEADVIQHRLVKQLIALESTISYATFHVWVRIFEKIAEISNLSEKLAHRMRMTLELK